MKKKVLHILYSGLGGHGSVFRSFLEADVEKKYDYTVILYGIENPRKEYLQLLAAHKIPFEFVKKRRGLDIGFYKRLFDAIKKMTPEIIFLHGSSNIMSAFFYQLLGGKAQIITRETHANHLKTKMDWLFLFLGILFTDKIVFLSKSYLQEIQQTFGFLLRKKKVAVIPNGINLNKFYPNKAVIEGPRFNVGMVSRLIPIKDHLTLVRAIALLKKEPVFHHIQLLIAGDGESRVVIEKLVNELGLKAKVHFSGMLGEAELITFYQQLDLYIHASFGETMSTAIMQAQACGLPMIASDVRGINNVITDGENGLLVSIKDALAMKDAILKIHSDKTLRKQFGNASLRYAEEKNSMQRMFNAYSTIFR